MCFQRPTDDVTTSVEVTTGIYVTTASIPQPPTSPPESELTTVALNASLTGSAPVMAPHEVGPDVGPLAIIMCLGVLLPAVVVAITAGVWAACRRRARHHLRQHAADAAWTSNATNAAASPSAAFRSEKIDNRFNEQHSACNKLGDDDADGDVTAKSTCNATPLTLTVVNVVDDTRSDGKTNAGPMRSSSLIGHSGGRRRRENVAVECCDFRKGSDMASEHPHHGESLNLKCGDELDKSFKNARRAAASKSGSDVTACANLSHRVDTRLDGDDVKFLRRSNCSCCRERGCGCYGGEMEGCGDSVGIVAGRASQPTTYDDGVFILRVSSGRLRSDDASTCCDVMEYLGGRSDGRDYFSSVCGYLTNVNFRIQSNVRGLFVTRTEYDRVTLRK